MARAVATTPHALAVKRLGEPGGGPRASVKGTAEALMTGVAMYLDIVLMHLARGDDYLSSEWYHSSHNALVSIRKETMSSPLASANIIAVHFYALALDIGGILGWVEPVACAPAVAAAITSALASVAKTVAAAPEESMAAVAELYASYADRAARRIVDGITDARSLLRDGRAPAAAPIPTSPPSSGPKSSVAANKSFAETTMAEDGVMEKRRAAAQEVQRAGPLTQKDPCRKCDCTPMHL
ncbi:hypothetical protein GE09DRAFT_283722 [Coniochaeta sp. 2T2.1]|nr:hypothetical protein GE09DRAFT_283722 [Coniochaeta sp. 2T2.1]